MTIEIDDKYINGVDVEEIKKEFISFLQSKTKKKSIEEKIKSLPNVNKNEADEMRDLFRNISSKLKDIDPDKAKEEYFREKGVLKKL